MSSIILSVIWPLSKKRFTYVRSGSVTHTIPPKTSVSYGERKAKKDALLLALRYGTENKGLFILSMVVVWMERRNARRKEVRLALLNPRTVPSAG